MASWLFDAAENANHFHRARSYPRLSRFSLQVGPAVTFAKWLLTFTLPVVAVLGFALG